MTNNQFSNYKYWLFKKRLEVYFINIYQRLLLIDSLCFPLTFFIAFLSFLFPCFCSLFLSNLFKIHRKNVGKASYKTFNILLFLAIAIDAIVFTYSKRKCLSLCNFATFYFFQDPVLFWWRQVPFFEWHNSLVATYFIFSISFSFTCIELWTSVYHFIGMVL